MPHADHLELTRSGTVTTTKKFEVPRDEFGIPRREALVDMVLGSVASAFEWSGMPDVHHIAWPYSVYRELSSDDSESVGMAWREIGSNKIRWRRQTHEYAHLVTIPLAPPDESVMVQDITEHAQGRKLYEILKLTNQEVADGYINERLEYNRLNRYLGALEGMPETQLHRLPSHEELAGFWPEQARAELGYRTNILTVIA